MQGASFAYQVFQIMRFGALILAAIAMAWLAAPQRLIDDFETLMLIGGSTTFFWVGGLLDGFLLLQKRSDPLHGDAIQKTTVGIAVSLALGSAIACGLVGTYMYKGLNLELVLLFSVYLALETLSQTLPYHYIAYDRRQPLLWFGFYSAIGYCIAVMLPLYIGWEIEGVVLMLLFVAFTKCIWLVSATRHILLGQLPQRGTLKSIWKISSPLLLATLLSQSAVYVDGFLVQRFFPDQFVDFRYGAKEFPLVLLLANSMSIVRAGEIAAGVRDHTLDVALQGLRAGSRRLMWTMFPLSILLLVLSGPLFEYFFKGRFPLAMPVFDIFLLLAIPRLMFPQSVVRGFQKTYVMSLSAGVELVLSVGLSLLLLPRFGIAGIAAGTVIAFFAEKGILLGYAQFKLGVSWHRYAPIPLWLVGSLALLLTWILKYLL